MMMDAIVGSCEKAVSGLFSWHIRYFRDCVYIAVPKTGSHTVASLLGFTSWSGRWRHDTARRIIQRIGLRSWKKKFTFASVRNPYSRLVAQYHYTVVPGLRCNSQAYFRQWAKAHLSAELYPCRRSNVLRDRWNQVQYIRNDEGDVLVDFIVHLETIEEDMRVVCERLNIPFSGVPHLNKELISFDYRDYYDDETVEVVGNWFREDLEQFGYDFDGLIAP